MLKNTVRVIIYICSRIMPAAVGRCLSKLALPSIRPISAERITARISEIYAKRFDYHDINLMQIWATRLGDIHHVARWFQPRLLPRSLLTNYALPSFVSHSSHLFTRVTYQHFVSPTHEIHFSYPI